MTGVRMAARVRYEVVLRRPAESLSRLPPEQLDNEIAAIRSTLIGVMAEADARGAIDEANLMESFNSPEEKRRIGTLINVWRIAAQKLRIDEQSIKLMTQGMQDMLPVAGDPSAPKRPDGAGDPESRRDFLEGLEMLRALNREFLGRACRRLGEVLKITADEWDEIYTLIPRAEAGRDLEGETSIAVPSVRAGAPAPAMNRL